MHVRFYTRRWKGKWEPWVYNLSIIKTNMLIESIYPCIRAIFLCSSRFSPVEIDWILETKIVVFDLITNYRLDITKNFNYILTFSNPFKFQDKMW